MLTQKLTPQSYSTSYLPTWCPGCGDFGILAAIKNALAQLQIPPHNVVIVYGIGCAGNMNNNIKCYAFHSLHGRTLPVAIGAKLANKNLKVITVAGDGDFYGEGGNHFLHTARYNADILSIVCNNRLFSLTTGQASPTSEIGMISKTTPFGEIKQPLNPIALSLSAGATFVGRGAAFDILHLTDLIKQGLEHKGFAHLDVFQQCVTFNKTQTVEWYKQRIYKLEETDYDKNNFKAALEKSLETEKLPIGIFYQVNKLSYEDGFEQLQGAPLVEQKTNYAISELMNEFR